MKKTLRVLYAAGMLTTLVGAVALQAAAAAPTENLVRLAGPAAAPDPLPFKGTLEGSHTTTPLNPPFVFDRIEADGEATQLGQFESVGQVTVNFGTRPVTGVGTWTFTAANGDQLVADSTGFSSLVRPGLVLITENAVIDPNRSTGRFAGAEGAFTVERLSEMVTGGVSGQTAGTFEGTITLPWPDGPRSDQRANH